MKVTRKRAGQLLYHAGATAVLLLAAGAALPQSPGIAHLLPAPGRAASPVAPMPAGTPNGLGARDGFPRNDRERLNQDEARAHAGKARAERSLNDRLPRTLPNDKLSPDERRKLRQSLYDLGREMYQGG
ncbi:hypothetical protein AB4Z48_17145 [Cupriavidus sp. 2TAF22]|uniref:hypothetical protein n=1 Tax=unclassified Cupriavidus TaxID=2640874 RepID=UPI003F8E7E56